MRSLGKRFYVLVIFAFFLVSVKSPFFAVSFAQNQCGEGMGGHPDKIEACCFKEFPELDCCATAENCQDNGKDCVCNSGYNCTWDASNSNMFWYFCTKDIDECGEENTPCCVKDDGTYYCNDPTNLACNWKQFDPPGVCQRCGHQGMLCCPDNICYNARNVCSDGFCKEPLVPTTNCKASGELCCYDGWNDGSNLCQTYWGVNPDFERCYCKNNDLVPIKLYITDGFECRCMGGIDCGLRNGDRCCDPPMEPCLSEALKCDTDTDTCIGVNLPPKGPVYNGPIIDSLEKILNPAVRVLYYGGLFVGIFFIILSGYKLMTSEGDPQRTKEAQEQLTSAIIGIIFILLSTTIIRIIMSEIIGI